MDFINLNFEVRNKNLNSDDKKDVKNKKDVPAVEDIQPELAKPSSELLKAYNNIVSFKGNNTPLENSINAILKNLGIKENASLIKNIVYSFDFKKQQFPQITNGNKNVSENVSDDKKSKKIKLNQEENIVYAIIDKCCADASLYIKYKDEIDKVLSDFGISLFAQ